MHFFFERIARECAYFIDKEEESTETKVMHAIACILFHLLCFSLCNKQVFDGAVGDVTITDERAKIVDFTMPYAPSGVSLLVLADNDSKPAIQWIFLKPLTKELWLTTVGFFFFTGFVVWVIEWPRNNPVYQGSSVAQFSTASYFAFSTLTFSHGQHLDRAQSF